MHPWKSPANHREVISGNEQNDFNAHRCVMWQMFFFF